MEEVQCLEVITCSLINDEKKGEQTEINNTS